MLLPWWKNQNLLNPEEIWRLKIASMVIALGWNRRDRSLKSPDGKIVSNFAILRVFPTTCDAIEDLKLYKKYNGHSTAIK